MEKYFVLLCTFDLKYIPMVDEDGVLLVFDDVESARCDADANMIGGTYGYEIFRMGDAL